jgi:hypothetical protein
VGDDSDDIDILHSEDTGRMHLRNDGNIDHSQTVYQTRNSVNIPKYYHIAKICNEGKYISSIYRSTQVRTVHYY